MRYKPPAPKCGMVGEQWSAWEEISTQMQQQELRLVYLCSLVMRN